jgi:hypothetical protein
MQARRVPFLDVVVEAVQPVVLSHLLRAAEPARLLHQLAIVVRRIDPQMPGGRRRSARAAASSGLGGIAACPRRIRPHGHADSGQGCSREIMLTSTAWWVATTGGEPGPAVGILGTLKILRVLGGLEMPTAPSRVVRLLCRAILRVAGAPGTSGRRAFLSL